MKAKFLNKVATSLNSRSSVAEVEKELTNRNIRLQPSSGGQPYAVDDHFAKYSLGDINTVDDALALCDRLDAADGGHCQKASQIRQWLQKDFWRVDPDRIRTAVACNRRVCCHARESGSFAPSGR